MRTVSIYFILLGLIPGVNSEQRAVPRAHALVSVTHVDYASRLAGVAVPQEPSAAVLARILTNRSLWGKDLGAALSGIPAWNQSGESAVVLFSDRVMGNTGYEKRQQAETASVNLAKAMSMTPEQPVPAFRDLLGVSQAVRMHPEVLPYVEDAFHVYLVDSAIQMLNPELTPAGVQEILGKPERVSKLSIDGKGDRRGLVLTLYSYAGGKITFAQADVSSRPGRIDRVFLDVPAVMTALFQEGK
ncbi:MAG TPA: hypothetical protein VNW27_00075 [Candidatus Bathyarchaeia archaeon]|jgi:hypothetical protein|nr:hypothetical protein [Candidatus Bathyarchaeia archaeon]